MSDDVVRFGGLVPEAIDQLLRDAALAYYGREHEAERLLLEARSRDPRCLPVYFAMYKFYFYKQRLLDAEQAVLAGLAMAAQLGQFPVDWAALTPRSATWEAVESPAHFYLFSLKALAFIRLRLGRPDESAVLLAKLSELDPQDQVGGSVIRALAHGST